MESCHNRVFSNCSGCTIDHDLNHHPNNYDCANYAPITIIPFYVLDLATLVKTSKQYRTLPEYQYVDGSFDRERKIIYQSVPYKPETRIHELWHILFPQKTESEVETESQQYLKQHKRFRQFLERQLRDS